MLIAIAAYCIVLGVIAATALVASKGKMEARKRNISANAQAKAQQGASTSEDAPLKGAAETTKQAGKRGGTTKRSAFALYAAAVLLVVVAAGGVTWYMTGRTVERTGWQPPTCSPPTAGDLIRRYMDMTDFTYTINTASKTAQRLFDIGLLQSWNFNQPEALRAFQYAAEADPGAAMVYFGQAYALGPGANRDVTSERKMYPSFAPEDFPAVYAASQNALKSATKAAHDSPDSQMGKKELALATALAGARFPEGTAAGDRRHAAEAEYAVATAKVGIALNDAAIMAMAAEAFMNLSPWDYYEEGNELKETASRAEELINKALIADPKNPLALHLHIHIAEASSPQRGPHLNAARAEASAQVMLTKEGPWTHGFGHLQHMPSHTFVRLGQWHNAVVSNVNAYNADVNDGAACMSPYEPEHNTDMLIYAANMAGEFKVAEQFSQLMRQYPTAIPTAYPGDTGADWTHLILTYVIQGKWEAIMALPGQGPPKGARALCPAQGYQYAVAVYHYARTLALAAKAMGLRAAGQTGAFYDAYVEGTVMALERLQAVEKTTRKAERTVPGTLPGIYACNYKKLAQSHCKAAETRIREEERTVPGEAPGIYACDYKKLAQIHIKVAEARIELLQGNMAGAETALQAAHEMEAGMGYMEPPRLYQPVKHCLGYVLMQASNHQRAAEVFVETMMNTPNSGFALFGMAESLRSLNRTKDAAQIDEVYKKAWENADGPLDSSCPSFSRMMSPVLSRGHRRSLA